MNDPEKMEVSTLFITGIPVAIRWKWHGPDQFEWSLDHKHTNSVHAKKLLENFLRAMRSDYIEYMLNEELKARTYAEQEAIASMMGEDYQLVLSHEQKVALRKKADE